MRYLIWLAVLMACDPCPEGLGMSGKPDPRYDELLVTARRLCGPLKGSVEWTHEAFACPETGHPLCAGVTYYGPGCANVKVMTCGDALSPCSALAHEICHAWCGAVGEDEAETCGAWLRMETIK